MSRDQKRPDRAIAITAAEAFDRATWLHLYDPTPRSQSARDAIERDYWTARTRFECEAMAYLVGRKRTSITARLARRTKAKRAMDAAPIPITIRELKQHLAEGAITDPNIDRALGMSA